MARPARLPRTSALAAGLLALGLTACSPITTQEPYAPSDGVQVELESQITGQNLMILTAAAGEPGVLLGALTNNTESATSVTVEVGSTLVTLPISARQTMLLSAPDAVPTATLGVVDVVLAAVEDPPGSVADVRVSTPESGSVTVAVPVLDGTLDPYDDVLRDITTATA